MLDIDTAQPVLVTGATGYVAGWIVKRLLQEGVTVHAAVRDPTAQAKLKHLDELARDLPGSIRYFKADLLEEGSYTEAMVGCRIVFHTASPFKLDIQDPQRDLIDPALRGTQNVLRSVNQQASVQRVVLTSSCGSIYGDNADLLAIPNGVLTEEHWNTSSSLAHQAYSYSKTLAEREAWQWANEQTRWRLVAINPSLVIGPGVNPWATSESFDLIRRIGDGRMKTGMPDYGIGAVDVRDVAEAHLRAAYQATAQGRYIISAHNTSFPELARTLLKTYGNDYPIPRRVLPKYLVWLFGPLSDRRITRRIVARNVGFPLRLDNSKSVKTLAMTYRPLDQSMGDFFQQLIDSGQLKAKR